MCSRFLRSSLRETLRRVQSGPRANILDVGCGTGTLLAELALRWPMASLAGVDGSEAMLSVAKARLDAQVNLRLAEAVSFRWILESEDSHHRLGRLIVGVPEALYDMPETGEIKLRVLGVGTAVRTFTWEL